MLFNSIEFLPFLIAVLVGYSVFKSHRILFLLGASYFFYGWWNWNYLILIVLSTLTDYYAGIKLSKSDLKGQERKFYLGLSIFINLGILFSFKYFNFFVGEVNRLMDVLHLDYLIPYTDFLLPMGISFYTFQTMSYTIDLYNRKIEPEYHLPRFALYVTFFPQLVAGPIERAGHLIGQLKNLGDLKYENFRSGLGRVVFGLVKKVVIADRLALFVNQVYGDVHTYDGFILLLATVFFAFQIYCDFSGYSDIAIGIAKMFGVDLMENFRNPYLAKDIRDFWARWHISLSTWFRDYVYIPLGGNRNFFIRNILIVFVVSGLWHGANWTFIIWGGLHGLYLLVTKLSNKWNVRLPAYFKITFTFIIVSLAWVFFRANNVQEALYIIRNFSNWNLSYAKDFAYQMKLGLTAPQTLINALNLDFSRINFQYTVADLFLSFGFILSLLIIEHRFQSSDRAVQMRSNLLSIFIMIILIMLFGIFSENQFIYFQF